MIKGSCSHGAEMSEKPFFTSYDLSVKSFVSPLKISAALASNLGGSVDSADISALGNESTSLSTGQIQMINPRELLASINTLGSVMGWNQGQVRAIILSLMSSGMMQVVFQIVHV